MAGALEYLTQRYAWRTDVDYQLGYNAFVQLREELMGQGINRLILEIRALRGVDDATPGYDDPTTNPFEQSLGTIEDNKRAIETTNAKLEEIRLLVEAMQGALKKIAARLIAAAALLCGSSLAAERVVRCGRSPAPRLGARAAPTARAPYLHPDGPRRADPKAVGCRLSPVACPP